MKRKLRIIWCVIAPLALIGGLIYFLTDITLINFLIWLGICVAVNLPMLLSMLIDDAADNRILTFCLAIILSPIWLTWNWISTIKSLAKGRSGTDWLSSGGGNGKSGKGGTGNNSGSSSDADKAIRSVVSDSSNYPDGTYVRVARKDVNFVTTKTFGIKIYGSVTYKQHHVGPARSENEYIQDIKNCITRTQEKLMNAAKRTVQGTWEIEISLKPEVE